MNKTYSDTNNCRDCYGHQLQHQPHRNAAVRIMCLHTMTIVPISERSIYSLGCAPCNQVEVNWVCRSARSTLKPNMTRCLQRETAVGIEMDGSLRGIPTSPGGEMPKSSGRWQSIRQKLKSKGVFKHASSKAASQKAGGTPLMMHIRSELLWVPIQGLKQSVRTERFQHRKQQ